MKLITTEAGARSDGKPFVILKLDGKPAGQISPTEAMRMGVRFIQSSIEAERDAGVVSALRAHHRPDEEIGALLASLREYRQQVDPDPGKTVRPERERMP